MDQLTQTLLLLILVMATIGVLMWVEKVFILPQKDKILKKKLRATQKRYRARRLCSKHIICLHVKGSMAILDEFKCHLCERERMDGNG